MKEKKRGGRGGERKEARMVSASWAKIVHHRMTCVTRWAMPMPVPTILRGLGNVSVELEGG